jgi:threonine dehydrogenase-like Zn-dependent dehydrogenase
MLALVYDGKQALMRGDYPQPSAPAGQALIGVRMAGVCRTDLEILKGYMNFSGVLGHEFVGTVLQGPARWKGKRIVAEINCVCGRCDLCVRGLSNHCRNRTVVGIDGRDGCFAQQIVLPARNLHEVPPSVSDEQAVMVEPLAAAMQIVKQVRVNRTDNVVVLGDGKLGQLVARALKGHTTKLLLVGKHAAKLEAAEKQGIQTVLADEFLTRGLADIVVEATGRAEGLELAMRTVRPRGTIVLKSTIAAQAGMNLAPLVVNEVTVVGSRCGPFGDAIRALASRQVDVDALVSAVFPLRQGLAALEAAGRSENIKVLLDMR